MDSYTNEKQDKKVHLIEIQFQHSKVLLRPSKKIAMSEIALMLTLQNRHLFDDCQFQFIYVKSFR